MCRVLRGLNFQQLENGGVIEAIIKAVKDGRIEFVAKILKEFPELVWCVEKSTGRNIFMLVVLYRQDEVFHFLCRSPEKNSILARVDFDSNSILHFAAMLEPFAKPNKAPGAALLMQREVHWFKEVQRVVHPSTLERTNKNGQTPRQLFIESHKELMKEGEKWVKEIANSCAVVGALIVSIMFAAAITVPGGNKQESGLPMFLNAKVFMLFIIFDALSLLSASYSLLMFLNLTLSSYEAEDFLQSLPKKVTQGIFNLIFSIATMMITFYASLFIILKGKLSVIIPVICFASVPVARSAWMLLRLLVDMFYLTFGSILGKKAKYGAMPKMIIFTLL
uniref:PGG domain-containing protein n=2 Tax=Quercus lobata TaxID=97700 RepID=A0A7N2LGJ0_QUELO